MMMIHPCHALSGVIVDKNKYEDKYNFLLIIGDGVSSGT